MVDWHSFRVSRSNTFLGIGSTKMALHTAMKNGSVRCRCLCRSFSPTFCICATKIAQNIHHYRQNKWISFQITVQSRHNFLESIFFLLPSFRRSSTIFSIFTVIRLWMRSKVLSPTECHRKALRIYVSNRIMIIGPARSIANLTIDQRQHPNDKKKGRIEDGEEKKLLWKIDCVRAREK